MSTFTLWMIFINTFFWVGLSFGLAYVVRFIPLSFYSKFTLFKEFSFEKKFFKVIKIKKWKDKLPEAGKFWSFEKKKLSSKLDIEYLDRFIKETYYAELGHLLTAILGFGCILINPSEYFLMALICSILNAIIHIPFYLIQRYNRPRLIKVRLRTNK